MSQRTIIELNRDYAHKIEECADLPEMLNRAMGTGDPKDWKPLERYGIRRVVQLHHSDDRKVVTKFGEYPIP